MKESGLMRVLFCKIHCPFICFCKPSAAHLYTQAQLKLENTPHVPSSTVVAGDPSGEIGEAKEESLQGSKQQAAINGGRRSCIRKAPKEIEKKKSVQWVDNLGKDLVEIKEFETSPNVCAVKQETPITKMKTDNVFALFFDGNTLSRQP
nr:Acetyl-coenzyme A synthetase [Ipomoea batatas]